MECQVINLSLYGLYSLITSAANLTRDQSSHYDGEKRSCIHEHAHDSIIYLRNVIVAGIYK